jgi:calcineurin-like phosphoesterase family protein
METWQPYVDAAHRLPFRFPGWVISDTHFLHARLEEYEPIRRTLGQDHNVVMVERWRETVRENDIIVHLGDLVLGKRSEFARIADRLPGRKFMLKTGNHDRRSRAWYTEHGFTLIPEFWMDYRGWRVRFSHRPDDEHRYVQYPLVLNVHGHIHSNTRADRRLINVSAEAIDFRPVWITDALDARIDMLNPPCLRV